MLNELHSLKKSIEKKEDRDLQIQAIRKLIESLEETLPPNYTILEEDKHTTKVLYSQFGTPHIAVFRTPRYEYIEDIIPN